MPRTVFGLPTHALLVHGTVVLVPLAALAVVLYAVWPEARRRLGIVMPLLAAIALALVPLSTESGESLEEMVSENSLVRRHAELAEGLLPWAVALFAVAVGLWLLFRWRGRARTPVVLRARWVSVTAGVLSVVAAAGVVQQVVRVGHAGAQATWNGVVQTAPQGGDGDND